VEPYNINYIGDCSQVCLYDAIFDAHVRIDLTEIGNAYNALSQANPYIDPNAFGDAIITHEIGHALGFGDINLQTANGICSEVQSIMYNRSPMILCGNFYPSGSDLVILSLLYGSMPWCPIDYDTPWPNFTPC
jgi:hypothetical protein